MDAPSGLPAHDAPPHSSTLPRGFVFHYTDGPAPAPKTPEPAEQQQQQQQQQQQEEEPQQPPPPPRLRVKRRRPLVLANLHCDIPSSDHPLPSIELSESTDAPPAMPLNPYTPQDHLLSPSSPACLERALSPPKTPLGQMTNPFDSTSSTSRCAWAVTPNTKSGAHHINRPPSAWSELSDSSISSLGSSDTFPPNGDCISPDTDDADPFTFPETLKASTAATAPAALASPMQVSKPKSTRRAKNEPQADWTSEMDEHLWLTYMKYLCDPTVTPFKTLPGSAPPLGVCHRVAREAKRTFRGSRAQLTPIAEHRHTGEFASIDSLVRRESSMPLESHVELSRELQAEPVRRPHSTTGVKAKSSTRWSASSHQTRKRLRHLCKRKPTLSPHYQRLMQSRSPSPMDSSSPHATIRPSHASSSHSRRSDKAFSTRDLNFTLSTATASTMQPGNPLSQLSGETAQLPAPSTPERPQSRCNPHQKSQSLQLGLGLGRETQQTDSMRRLASPFQESYWQPPTEAGPSSSSNVVQLPSGSSDSHLQIHQPRPLSGSMKRRAQYQLGDELLSDDPELRRDYLEHLFRDSGVGAGKRRVRSRGFSLGAVSGHQQQRQPSLSELFTPPSNVDSDMAAALPTPSLSVTQHDLLQPPPPPTTAAGANTRRLGSPFAPSQNSTLSNTFPRSLFPQGLDSIFSLEHQQQQQQQQQTQSQDDVMMDTPRQSDFGFGDQSSPP